MSTPAARRGTHRPAGVRAAGKLLKNVGDGGKSGARAMTAGRSNPAVLTRDDVVRGAVRVIGRDGPQTTMSAIAAEVGIAKPRLYRMFADKSDLDRAVAEWLVAEIRGAAAPDLSLVMKPRRETIHRFLEAGAQVIHAHPNVFRFVAITQTVSGGDDSARPLDIGRRMSAELADHARTVFTAVGLDTAGIDHLARGIVGFVVSVTDLWLDVTETPAPEAIAEAVDLTTDSVCDLLDGFLRRKGVHADPERPVVETLAAIAQQTTGS